MAVMLGNIQGLCKVEKLCLYSYSYNGWNLMNSPQYNNNLTLRGRAREELVSKTSQFK